MIKQGGNETDQNIPLTIKNKINQLPNPLSIKVPSTIQIAIQCLSYCELRLINLSNHCSILHFVQQRLDTFPGLIAAEEAVSHKLILA